MNQPMQQDAVSSAGSAMTSAWRKRLPAWVLRAYAVAALVVAGINSVNITTLLHDAVARHGLPVWKAVVWETTSGLMVVLCAAIPLAALVRAMPGRTQWLRFLGVHVAASLLFSVLHVAGMIALRMVVYRMVGESYGFEGSLSEFLYEYRKDVAAYALIAGIGWVALRLDRPEGAQVADAPVPSAAAAGGMLEIRDGSRLVVASVEDILYARA